MTAIHSTLAATIPLDEDEAHRLANEPLREPWRGPHEGRELGLMLDHGKPAALVRLHRRSAFLPHADRFVFGTIQRGPRPSFYQDDLIVTQRSHMLRLGKIATLLAGPKDRRYHIEMGLLLGYHKDDIRAWLAYIGASR